MTTSRQLVRAAFSGGKVERRPLLLLAFQHAARFDGAPFDDLIGDATRLSRALLQQRQLMGGDCVSVHFDEAWFAEADGEGVFATLVDVVDRMVKQLRRDAPVLVMFPGPLLLASRIGAGGTAAPEQSGAMLRDLIERCCRAGAELVLLREDGDAPVERVAAMSAPIINTVRYYNATPILWGPERPQEALPDPALFPAEAAKALIPGRKSGLVVPGDCLGEASSRAKFLAKVAAQPDAVFLAVVDEALARNSVGTNTEAMRELAI